MSFLPKFFPVYKEDHEYDDLFGSEVGSDISDAEEALQEEKAEEKEDIENVKTIPGFDDPKIKKLIIKRHQKANELQKMLKIVERTKQRMKVDVQTLNALSSDVLALNSEIEYLKKLIAKGGGSAANENAYKDSGLQVHGIDNRKQEPNSQEPVVNDELQPARLIEARVHVPHLVCKPRHEQEHQQLPPPQRNVDVRLQVGDTLASFGDDAEGR
eukprot:g61735.t1